MNGLVWRLYLGVGALAIVVYYLLPPLAGAALNLVVGASASVAILVGLRWYRPPRRAPWWLIAAAQALFVPGTPCSRSTSRSWGSSRSRRWPMPSTCPATRCWRPGWPPPPAGTRRLQVPHRQPGRDHGRRHAVLGLSLSGAATAVTDGMYQAAYLLLGAAELHDGPIQRLAVLSYDPERAKQRVLGNPAAVARIEHTQAALSAEVQGLRELLASLRPPTLAPGCGSGPCSGCPRRPSRCRSAPGGGRSRCRPPPCRSPCGCRP
jgi:Histidine kinase